MSVLLRNIQIPLFIKIDNGAYASIREILNQHHLNFTRPLVLTEEAMLTLGGDRVVHELGDPGIMLFRDNSLAESARIVAEIREKKNDVIVSIGGGRILDLGKHVATKAGINYISMPTSPSNDGICSPIAVLKNDDGVTESIGVQMPIGVVVDTAMLTSAPEQNVRSGIGELISNFSAITDWRMAAEHGKDHVDDFAASIAFSAAELIFQTCRGVKVDLNDADFLGKLVHGLILSGIAMNIAGSSRPCSGSEHEFYHALEAANPGAFPHGIAVAFGTLIAMHLRGEDLGHMVDFFTSVGLPRTLEEFGIDTDTAVAALLEAPHTRPGRHTILEERHLNEKALRREVEAFSATIESLIS